MPFTQKGLEPSPNSKPRNSGQYREAIAVQQAVFADAIDPETPAAARAQLARAWKDLGEFRLRLKMRPAPKPIDVSADQKPKRSRARDAAKPFTEG